MIKSLARLSAESISSNSLFPAADAMRLDSVCPGYFFVILFLFLLPLSGPLSRFVIVKTSHFSLSPRSATPRPSSFQCFILFFSTSRPRSRARSRSYKKHFIGSAWCLIRFSLFPFFRFNCLAVLLVSGSLSRIAWS